MAFEGRESNRVPDALAEIVPDVGAKIKQEPLARVRSLFPTSNLLLPSTVYTHFNTFLVLTV